MVDRGRGQKGAKGRAETWPEPRVAQGGGVSWPHPSDLFQIVVSYLRSAAAVDFGPGRVVPWLPVAFGLGVAVYFTAEREPSWIAALIAVLISFVIVYAARRRAVAFPVMLVIAAFAAGFAIITARTAMIAHPVLDRSVFGASVTGFVEAREEREKSDRITIRVQKLEGTRMAKPPERVRLSVRRGSAPAVGSFVSLKARLNPPLAPLRPGGYDFARDLYFQSIGAVGFVTGAIKIETPPVSQGFRLSYAAFVDGIRDGIDKRIRASVQGDGGSIASALITGKRDAISKPVNDAMYISSLAHVLSISG